MNGVLAPSEIFIRQLSATSPVNLVGEKAFTLGRMIRSGYRVPDGFVLTAPVFAGHRRGEPMNAAVRAQLCEATTSLLQQGPVVVRSSAIGEDGAGHSFAGQLDSILHVHDFATLEQAVLECWDSYWSERASYYRKASDAPDEGMGVIVQLQVDAKLAGVMFTEASNGTVLIEYVSGLADALVAGSADPERLLVDTTTGQVMHLVRENTAMDDDTARVLCGIGKRLELELGGPQDVEWVLATNGNVYVVQSRPITAPVYVAKPKATEAGLQVSWSNANVNENFPRPVSPLLFSIASAGYTHYFRNLAKAFGIAPRRMQAMDRHFNEIIGLHGARMYYNLTAIHTVLRLAPFGKALAALFDGFVGADGNDVAVDTIGPRGRLRQVGEVTVIAAKTAWHFRNLDRRVSRFETTVDAFATQTHLSRLPSMSLVDLRRSLAQFRDIRCNQWLDASLADCSAMVCYGILEKLLARAYPDGSRATAHTSLLKAIPDVVSGIPVHRLWDLSRLIRADDALADLFERDEPAIVLAVVASDDRFARFRSELQRYLNDWGFRCSEELMLTTPNFQEDPVPLVEMLRAYARLDLESPAQMLSRQATEREAETARIKQELLDRPLLRFAISAMIPWTQAAVRFRERARLKQALLYNRCRLLALQVGERLVNSGDLDERDDAFFLTYSELLDLPLAAARARATMRRSEHVRASQLNPPDAFVLPEGTTWQSGMDCHATPVSSNGVCRGIPACGGRVTGRATVLRDVTEAAQLASGDVLVTKQTDPGWGPVFFLIAGLVIERGGMLSHGAIIAREFGIPCVVGVRNAMRTIPSGSTVEVNADEGEVRVLA